MNECVSNSDFRPGDHIAKCFEYKGRSLAHHGIVVPGRETLKVVDFSSSWKKGGEGNTILHEQSIAEYAEGSLKRASSFFFSYSPRIFWNSFLVVQGQIVRST